MRVFISYRRGDTRYLARMVYDRLERELGRENVFMDVDSIPLGTDFVATLEGWIARCDVLLALIGEHWLNIVDPETGTRRLDNPQDYVRIEIGRALSRDIRVVPVLIDDASMPSANEMPVEMQPLANRQAERINYPTLDDDVNRLVRRLALIQNPMPSTPAKRVAVTPVPYTGSTVIRLRVPPNTVPSRMALIRHSRFHQGISSGHWRVNPDGGVPGQAVCWLYCWAKTGMNSSEAASFARSIFSEILDCSYDVFDQAVGHEWAQRMRYAVGNIEPQLAALLEGARAAEHDRMRKSYRPEIARFIADAARVRKFLSYQDLADKFGGIARGFGDRLGGITIFCRKNKLPLLPIIVVSRSTGRPSESATLYRDYGIVSDAQIDAEQEACFGHDWSTVAFEAS